MKHSKPERGTMNQMNLFPIRGLYMAIISINLFVACTRKDTDVIDHIQGEIAGEVTQNSVILQSRLTQGSISKDGDVPGMEGFACFEISTTPDFEKSFKTQWIEAISENDYIVKTKVTDLRSGTRYYYRLLYGPNIGSYQAGSSNTFGTCPESTVEEEVSFVVVTGMNYSKFHFGVDSTGKRAYTGEDKELGYPGLATILQMKPDFFVGTGDNVYYDFPPKARVQTQSGLRKKWHQQFLQPRYKKLFSQVPTYWEKDDHDHRYNDCDTAGTKKPSNRLGIQTFVEQLPIVDPNEKTPKTYRTHRINSLLQIWLVEGRDYRSPNDMPDGPEKSLWGKDQNDWLKRTLLESDATFKILISPTPLVGPDDAYKKDNHTNPLGFRYEGNTFFEWLTANGFLDKNFCILCGDRHWQYHSAHPSGFEEFSCGALVDANSRLGRKPGDPESTDPEGLITQHYTQEEKSGGFLRVIVKPDRFRPGANATFQFFDEKGVLLYMVEKRTR